MMVSQRRSGIQVVADILRVNGSKTSIIYGANLNHAQGQKYLEVLVRHGLLECVSTGDGRYRYSTTEKGKELLELIESLEAFMEALEDKSLAA